MPRPSPIEAPRPLPVEDWSEELILAIAQAKGIFTVSAKARQGPILDLCWSLKVAGRLTGGRDRGGSLIFYPVR